MTLRVKLPVTYLFVPGDRPERFDKALASGADAVILDLEDAVSPRDKDEAAIQRARVGRIAARARRRIVVRINDGSTPWFDADLALLDACRHPLRHAAQGGGRAQIAAVVEALPAGRTGAAADRNRARRGQRRCRRRRAAEWSAWSSGRSTTASISICPATIAASSTLRPGSRSPRGAPGSRSPVAGVTPAIDDEERLLADLAFARAFGFGAKLCIHPKQVAAIRKALLPTAAEVDWARRVLAAAEGAHGAVQVDGRMVDRPVLLKARAILDRLPP